MRRGVFATVLVAAAAMAVARPTAARADGIGDLVGAVASSTAREEQHVARLFDEDEATVWCAREKVHVSVTMTLSAATHLDSLELSLGDPMGWKATPRVKQVFVTVREGEKTIKKVRHKWPDRDEPRTGTVNLDATGDNVLLEVNQVYAGSTMAGLCLAGLRLTASDPDRTPTVDAATLASAAWSEEQLAAALTRTWKVTRGEVTTELELTRKKTFEYRDTAADLKVSGRWTIEPTAGGMRQLALTVTKAKVGRKRLAIPAALAAPHAVPWRFRPTAEGDPPTFVPWGGYALDEAGGLTLVTPTTVGP